MHFLKQLVSKGLLKQTDLDTVVELHAANPGKPLHELLIEKGFIREDDLLPILADEFGMELVDLAKITVEADTLKTMPLKLVHRRNIMPIHRENGTLKVATGD